MGWLSLFLHSWRVKTSRKLFFQNCEVWISESLIHCEFFFFFYIWGNMKCIAVEFVPHTDLFLAFAEWRAWVTWASWVHHHWIGLGRQPERNGVGSLQELGFLGSAFCLPGALGHLDRVGPKGLGFMHGSLASTDDCVATCIHVGIGTGTGDKRGQRFLSCWTLVPGSLPVPVQCFAVTDLGAFLWT